MPTKYITVAKPWGYEKIIVSNPLYCMKILHYHSGARSSFHHHQRKSETFYILKGAIEIHFEGCDLLEKMKKKSIYIAPESLMRFKVLKQDDSIDLPNMTWHVVHALKDTDILEVSTEDDPKDCIRMFESEPQREYK